MEKSITIKPNELNINLIEALKKLFTTMNASEVTISFKAPDTASQLRNETSEETLLRIDTAIKHFEEGNKGIAFSIEEFNELSFALQKMK